MRRRFSQTRGKQLRICLNRCNLRICWFSHSFHSPISFHLNYLQITSHSRFRYFRNSCQGLSSFALLVFGISVSALQLSTSCFLSGKICVSGSRMRDAEKTSDRVSNFSVLPYYSLSVSSGGGLAGIRRVTAMIETGVLISNRILIYITQTNLFKKIINFLRML